MADPIDPSRRALLAAAAAGIAVAPHTGRCAVPAVSPAAALADLSATEAVRRMAAGELTAEHYAAALLTRCGETRRLNAFITLDAEKVLEDARNRDRERQAGATPGPLFGLPIPVKDSVNTRDYATSGGTPALRHFRPQEDAPIVAALRNAGAVILGKTNLHELSYGWTSNNLSFGAVHNPYDRNRIPGGSSGGTAAAVAARMAPLGVAEDTEGSIRVPAALCGIAGFRPSTYRYSTRGCVPISPLFDQVGPHARCVADLMLFDRVAAAGSATPAGAAAAPAPANLRGLRLGVVRDFWFTGLDPEVEQITDQALQRLRAAGVEIVETSLPGLDRLIALTTDQVQNHDVRVALPQYLKDYGAGVDFETVIGAASTDIRALFKSDVLPGGKNFVSEAVYAAARDEHLPALRRLFTNYFAKFGVAALVFPATRVPAPPIGADTTVAIRGLDVPFDEAIARNIAPGSTAGLPGLVLPAGLTATGLPVALEFDGPAGGDASLLALGLALERELGSLPPPRV